VGNTLSNKEMTRMINSLLGQKVLTEAQLKKIQKGAKQAYHKGGMNGMIRYLMRVTGADVDPNELRAFADLIQSNPQVGKNILEGVTKLK
jgi:hypothetical protein